MLLLFKSNNHNKISAQLNIMLLPHYLYCAALIFLQTTDNHGITTQIIFAYNLPNL